MRPIVVLLLVLGACQAVPVGPASLQEVHPDYYSRTLKYHGGSTIRSDAVSQKKSNNGAVTVIAEEAPEGFAQETLARQLGRLQDELTKIRERIDWEQSSGAWRTAPGEMRGEGRRK